MYFKNKQYIFEFLVALIPNVSHVIQHENDADTVLICQGSKIE